MARKILVIKSSLRGRTGDSSGLVDLMVELWRNEYPEDEYVIRDFAEAPVPHLDSATFSAFAVPAEKRSTDEQALVQLSDTLIDELLSVQVLIIGVPMYNYGVPSTLKAYIDHVARAGRTFKYSESGSIGLAGQKKMYVLATRGGLYRDTPADVQTPWLVNVFAMFGITDLEFVYAEGLNISPARKSNSITAAQQQIRALLADSADR